MNAVVTQCTLLLDTPRTLVVFGSYTIGKERVFLEVARQCGVRIRVDRAKLRLLECMQLPADDMARLTSEETATRFHVVPMAQLRAPALKELLRRSNGRYTSCVAFRPTGWAYGRGASSASGRSVRLGDVRIVDVPYSEHSSCEELRECVRALRPARVVSTVGGGPNGDRHPGMSHLLSTSS